MFHISYICSYECQNNLCVYTVKEEAALTLSSNIEKAVNKPGHLGRGVLDVLFRVLAEVDVDILFVEAVVLGQDVLLVVPLQGLPQLDVGDGVALLGSGYLFNLAVEAGELVLTTILWVKFGPKRN